MEFIYEGQVIKFVFTNEQDYLARYISNNKTFFEEVFLRYLKNNKIIDLSSVVVDIGACIGNHTVYFSKIIGVKKVISIEPTTRSFEILQENIKLNNIGNVICKRVAISSSEGLAKCYVRKEGHVGSNRWVPIHKDAKPLVGPGGKIYNKESVKNNESVKTLPLGHVIDEKIDFIKIDVEDAENIVIEFGIDIIEKYRPILMVEVAKHNLEKFENLMNSISYIPVGTEVFTKNKSKKANTLLYKYKGR